MFELFKFVIGIIIGFVGTTIIIYIIGVLSGKIVAPTAENQERWDRDAKNTLRGKSPGDVGNPRSWFD